MPQRNLAWLLVVPSFVFVAAVLAAVAPAPDREYQLVRSVVDVLAEVDKNYYRELTPDEKRRLVEDMINGGLYRLDKHAQYYNEDELKQFENDTDGKFGGIGAFLSLDPETQRLQVESPMVGTPASEAGLLPGDLILKIDNTSTEGLKVDAARALIKGEPGSEVALTVKKSDSGKEEVVKVKRAFIKIYPVRGFVRKDDDPAQWDFLADKESKIALIRLSAFNKDTHLEVKSAVDQAEKAGAKALVLDLRGNGGGLLDQAVLISDLFLNEGVILSTKDRSGTGRVWKAKKGDTIFGDKPVAVLIDGGSASASEILAAALQENGRAAIVGERSYGKGSVQKVLGLSDGKSAMKITTEIWLTPKGRALNKNEGMTEKDDWGVKPDAGLEVTLKPEDYKQYMLHLNRLDLVKAKGTKPKETGPKLDPNFKDAILEKALEHLRKKVNEPVPNKPT
jgi:carboxyl-terminal processing protease